MFFFCLHIVHNKHTAYNESSKVFQLPQNHSVQLTSHHYHLESTFKVHKNKAKI